MSDKIKSFKENIQQYINSVGKPIHFRLEYYPGADWIRSNLTTDRTWFLEHKDEFEQLITDYGLYFQLQKGWVWENVYNEEFDVTVHQATVVYQYFISIYKQSKLPLTVSDTKDSLYDFGLTDLRDALVKAGKYHSPTENWCFSRHLNFYRITFYRRKEAEEFNRVNPFNRTLSWTKSDRSTYNCIIYFTDKQPDEVVTLESLTKRKYIPKPKSNFVQLGNKRIKLTPEQVKQIKEILK